MDHSRGEKDNSNDFLDDSEDAMDLLSNHKLEKYVLRLYIANYNQKSLSALENIQKLCEERLHGRYELEVIDIYQQPERLEEDQIFAIPTLIKEFPPPFKKLIGDLTDTEKLIIALAL
ncbi:circadian clock KaiB family protein [Chlorogloeopsis sp. ULAP01]|uniref:circadian clock KaiB family protein n=1 Tax=Chlorogloeopsis sp. ULAP01 TaxID=3056483 RepID=UPI0025AA99B9|nr:circadian clock KaiB family protein [Chlorogloeopsis sp. ULAP01]MDM9383861.1 circadian clock KaiB family protein [Chlorogloeopsis sp. ULAP01]